MSTTDTGSRGDQTREALLEAALDIFGQAGFDAASTRAIADSAGANQALISYHFDGKRGLYRAVFENIVAEMQQLMEPVIEEVMDRLGNLADVETERRHQAVQLMDLAFSAIIDMFGCPASAKWVRLMVREQQDPSEVFQVVYQGIMGEMMEMLTHLVSVASGLDAASEACRVRTYMLVGQVLIFHIGRGTVTEYLSWRELTPANIKTFKEQFRISLESQFSPGAVFQ
ncbi:MAG: AcrR family transcriptional regulator [Halieaceae bacterium]|jgi:AcrR family transcriptional regulator